LLDIGVERPAGERFAREEPINYRKFVRIRVIGVFKMFDDAILAIVDVRFETAIKDVEVSEAGQRGNRRVAPAVANGLKIIFAAEMGFRPLSFNKKLDLAKIGL